MIQSTPQEDQNSIRFCQQKVLCDSRPFTHDGLLQLLHTIYIDSDSFSGYLKFTSGDGTLLFLFFFKGSPYAAGRYTKDKPTLYSIQELARQLVKTDKVSLQMTLCEADPVLLKSMLLFLQKEPDIKAPTSLIDFECIVRQISEVSEHAMIALSRGSAYNFFFLKNGSCAQVYYADSSFERPSGMTLDEEMLLYAFQPGEPVLASIYRDMKTSLAEDSSQYDKDSLYELLTVGYLKNKRKGDQGAASEEAAKAADGVPATALRVPVLSHVILIVESGPLQGKHVTVKLPCTIGRQDCDLLLDDKLVSRRHAELCVVENKLVVTDLASKNGTRVNGEKIAGTRHLLPHDLLSFGPIDLRISPAVT